jgi:micrococcal nuclease
MGLVLLCLAADAAFVRAQSRDDRCIVASLADGDSFRCRDGRRVRLLGIDAPENDQPAGAAARASLARLMPPGTAVRLETDVQPRDRFGRVLAYAWRGERMVNEQQIRAGMAMLLIHAPNVRHAERLRAAQRTARSVEAGLWGTGGFACAPRDHRRGRC